MPRKHIDRDAPEAYLPAPRRRHGAIDHALTQFYEALDQGQKSGLAAVCGHGLPRA